MEGRKWGIIKEKTKPGGRKISIFSLVVCAFTQPSACFVPRSPPAVPFRGVPQSSVFGPLSLSSPLLTVLPTVVFHAFSYFYRKFPEERDPGRLLDLSTDVEPRPNRVVRSSEINKSCVFAEVFSRFCWFHVSSVNVAPSR